MSISRSAADHVSDEGHTRTRTTFGGGPDGNEQLTAATGVVLIVLLAAIGITILRIGQLTWLHFFLGFLLIGPVALKIASTGYRFTRYYTHSPAYRERGAPESWLRLLAPVVVLSTVVVFVSGVVLLFDGPAHRDPLLLVHKASFIIWGGATALHVLGHLIGLPAPRWPGRRCRPDDRAGRGDRRWCGAGGRPDPGLLDLDRASVAARPPTRPLSR